MRKISIVLALSFITVAASAQVSVCNLRTAGLDRPLGVDPSAPVRVGWKLESPRHDVVQQAYELTLKSGGRTVWKSGKTVSDNSTLVPLEAALEPQTAYTWTVRVWNNYGDVSKPVSAEFSTGLAKDGWKASWIGLTWDDRHTVPGPVYFRKSLKLSGKVKRAMVYATSHGIYELRIGGRKVGDSYLAPGWTSYQKTIQYQAYDVTPMLKQGIIELSAMVAPGWYASGLGWGEPDKRQRYGTDMALLYQLEIEYANGRREIVVSDGSWEMSATGPVTAATYYDGETIDLTVPYDWHAAQVLPAGTAEIVASVAEPVRVRTVLNPVKCITTPKGEKVIDFGQNLVGWEKLRIKGRRGQVVRISHAEVLDKDGNLCARPRC